MRVVARDARGVRRRGRLEVGEEVLARVGQGIARRVALGTVGVDRRGLQRGRVGTGQPVVVLLAVEPVGLQTLSVVAVMAVAADDGRADPDGIGLTVHVRVVPVVDQLVDVAAGRRGGVRGAGSVTGLAADAVLDPRADDARDRVAGGLLEGRGGIIARAVAGATVVVDLVALIGR